ncbi:DNA-3-methyladenine glycosylase 2 family protein [Taibaiella lutea]|uniref:DNA-3-methyladenine glycosylase II n=2 Tax=Taibaiella lutea TaxID=2608001 RepID=A0A5M6CQA1_9BACT|nr:DNA-3-methyladenine glycosylase 2 family protein [Taibaiella lutea]
MFNTFSKNTFQSICDKLAADDEDLDLIIKEHGYPPMWTRPNSFETLVHIILEQQVSLASALAALKKLQEKTGGLTPDAILKLNDEELKTCYVSRQKAIYIRNLATAITSGELNLEALANMPDDAVRTELIRLKGIGNWTIDVYLMFVLQRADVFPIGDLAAVNAMKRAKHFPKETTKETLLEFTNNWKPYRTVACMILWHHYLSAPMRNKVIK